MDEAKMSVSQIFRKDGQKTVYVEFTDGKRHAEGRLPDCRILSGKGFTEEETRALEDYLRSEQETILQTAGKINVMKAFMGK